MTPVLSLGFQLKTAKVAGGLAICPHLDTPSINPNVVRQGAMTLAESSTGLPATLAAGFHNTITKGGVLAVHYDDRLFFIGLGRRGRGVGQPGAKVPSDAPTAGKASSTQEKKLA